MKKLLFIIILGIAAYMAWRWFSPATQPTPVTNTNTTTDTTPVKNANTTVANTNTEPVVNTNTNTPPAPEPITPPNQTPGEIPTKVSGSETDSFLDGIKATFESGERIVLTVADLQSLMDAETTARIGEGGARFSGRCFNSYSLSPDRTTLIFGVSCGKGDLALPWVGTYDFAAQKASFLDGNGGRQYAWSADSKNVTYLGLTEADGKRRAIKNSDGTFTVAKAE